MRGKMIRGGARLSWAWLVVAALGGSLLPSCQEPAAPRSFAGLGPIERWPRRAWADAFTLSTAHYTIRTNTSMDTACDIGCVMEAMCASYRRVFGLGERQLPRLTIHVYATRREYDAIATSLGLKARQTAGFYTPLGGGAIHLPYIRDLRVHPMVTLLHEGTHQFLHEVVDLHVPPAAQGVLPADRQVLMSVPLWLNEGLATYLESAQLVDGRMRIGQMNLPRLRHLQRLARQQRLPSLRQVIATPRGVDYPASHYAVAWGIVYALRHDPDPEKQARGRRRLKLYIAACRKGFYDDPTIGFPRDFLPQGRMPENFDAQWARYIGRRSYEAFLQIIIGPDDTEAAWRQHWLQKMLHLHAQAVPARRRYSLGMRHLG